MNSTNIYISTNGSDSFCGDKVFPFKTLEKAQEKINFLIENGVTNIEVFLHNGIYNLTQPLIFSSPKYVNCNISFNAYNKNSVFINLEPYSYEYKREFLEKDNDFKKIIFYKETLLSNIHFNNVIFSLNV